MLKKRLAADGPFWWALTICMRCWPMRPCSSAKKHKHYLATAHRAWGVLYRLEGAYEEAEVRLDQAVALFKGLDTRWQLGRTHFELGELAAERAEAAEAKRQYARALALFEEMGAVPDAERTRAALLSLE
jgi:tetratricopeptide (TPR) repeat protein